MKEIRRKVDFSGNDKGFHVVIVSEYLSHPDVCKAIEKIKTFKTYKEGWNYGEGEAINADVIDKSINLVKRLSFKLPYDSSIFPTPHTNGAISTSFSRRQSFVDVIVNKNLSIDIKEEEGYGENYEVVLEKENVTYSEVFNAILKVCHSSVRYTTQPIIQSREDSTVIFSKIIKEESQYSTNNARSIRLVQSASI